MSRKRRIAAGVVIALTTILAGTAFALADISFITGTTANYDFGGFGPGFPVPGTVQIQAFTLAPGETIPWHFHKATSYVVLARGTLTEQHVAGPNQCDSEEVAAGSAFIEPAGAVHTVTNSGPGSALIWWATVFPQSDEVARFTPVVQVRWCLSGRRAELQLVDLVHRTALARLERAGSVHRDPLFRTHRDHRIDPRRAGRQQAITATANSPIAVTAKTIGSRGSDVVEQRSISFPSPWADRYPSRRRT